MGTIDKLKFAEDVAKKSEKYGFPTSEKSKKGRDPRLQVNWLFFSLLTFILERYFEF